MVKRTPAQTQEDKIVRARKRAGRTLRDQQVSEVVRSRYYYAARKLRMHWDNEEVDTGNDLDTSLSRYVEHLYQEGDSLSLATDTIASVQYFFPFSISQFKYSWKLCAIWRKSEPPNRQKPFTSLWLWG